MNSWQTIGVAAVSLVVLAAVARLRFTEAWGPRAPVREASRAVPGPSMRGHVLPTAPAATLNGVRFESGGWALRESSESRTLWTNAEGDALSIDLVLGPAEVPFDDDASVRAFTRRTFGGAGRGIVSADVVRIAGVPVVKFIYKREALPAYGYTGMMIIPGEGGHFVLVVSSIERGTTGVRDALVTVELLKQGRLDPRKTDARGRVQGWFRDPYDAQFDTDALNSVADDEQYDSLVPSHPLPKVRSTLREIQASMTFSR